MSYSLIESQPLTCTPACGHEFHAFTFHPHPTFTTPLVGSAWLDLHLESDIGGLWWSSFVETVNVFRLLTDFKEELHC